MSTKTPGHRKRPPNTGKCTLLPDGNSTEAKQRFPAKSQVKTQHSAPVHQRCAPR